MTFTVQIDWADNGFGTSGIDNVTDLVRGGFAAEFGRDLSASLAPIISGRGGMTLDNSDRRFSPRNTASPIYGSIKPARPVKISRTIGGVTYVLFYGHTDDSPINPDTAAKTASMTMVDALADFRGLKISTPLYSGIRSGAAIGYVLDACGWAGGRDLDYGATIIPYWWEDGVDALEALDKIVRSEGAPALLTVGTDGSIVFRDRHHRFTRSASLTSQGTWWGDGPEPSMGVPFLYDEAWKNIINTGLISVDVRMPQASQVVWSVDSPIVLAASEARTFIATASDPFTNAQTPTSGTDYTVTAGSVTPTLSRTSGASTTITLTAGGGGAVLSNLQLRAQPVQVIYTVQVTASDSTSIADYGSRSYPVELPWCNQYDAQAILDYAIESHKQPLPIIQARFLIGTNSTRAAAILPRNLSDRVTVREDETVLNNSFYVESFSHTAGGTVDHAVTVGAEMVPPDGTVTGSNIFIVGGGVAHQIGDGVLAR